MSDYQGSIDNIRTFTLIERVEGRIEGWSRIGGEHRHLAKLSDGRLYINGEQVERDAYLAAGGDMLDRHDLAPLR